MAQDAYLAMSQQRHVENPRAYVRAALVNASKSGVPVSAAAAALGHDPAIFLCNYAHLYPGDLRSVADAMDVARQSAQAGAVTRSTGRISRGDFAGTNRPAEFPSEA